MNVRISESISSGSSQQVEAEVRVCPGGAVSLTLRDHDSSLTFEGIDVVREMLAKVEAMLKVAAPLAATLPPA